MLLIEELIKAHLHELFAGHEIIDAYLFRITRDADFEVEEGEADDLLAAIEEELRQRRFGKVIRLEVEAGMSEEVRALLLAGLSLNADALVEVDGVLDLTVGAEIASLPHPELRAPTWQPVTPARITAASHAADGAPDLFEVIREGDLLMHYPYESFDASAERLFQQAASDPDVLSIRATLYRTGATSSIPGHLIQAARAGKEVVVLVELKARFDEAANIEWARRLEEAGAHVIYGMSGLKTHCKACLVVRQEHGVLRRYAHLGTGNYNPKTARIYTDFSLLTADEEITADVGLLFNVLTGNLASPRFKHLLVAPFDLSSRIVALIEAETAAARAGRPAGIFAKVNSLVDPEVIRALQEASNAGVQVDLVVRGICCLAPGVPGQSENIRVRSFLGRFLEHSRIYYFRNNGSEDYFIGSADVMHRNLDRRVEALVRIDSEKHKERLKSILDDSVSDKYSTWKLSDTNQWLRSIRSADGQLLVNFQDHFIDKHNRS